MSETENLASAQKLSELPPVTGLRSFAEIQSSDRQNVDF
jgi:hypothetical protein